MIFHTPICVADATNCNYRIAESDIQLAIPPTRCVCGMEISMQILKGFIIAVSIYSNIPVPQFEWEKEDMKYMMCFFPVVGAVIGATVYLWTIVSNKLSIDRLCYIFIMMAIPLIITGGFHVDGFMDTMDAFHSYQPREEKLKILKDSHIGAFAVIMLVLYGLIYAGAISQIQDIKLLKILCFGFFLSRCLSGIGVVILKPAKEDGMLHSFAGNSKKNTVKIVLFIQSTFCIWGMMHESFAGGGLIAMAAVLSFVYYGYRTKKLLGGITGDTAGYFILICEVCMAVTAAVVAIF